MISSADKLMDRTISLQRPLPFSNTSLQRSNGNRLSEFNANEMWFLLSWSTTKYSINDAIFQGAYENHPHTGTHFCVGSAAGISNSKHCPTCSENYSRRIWYSSSGKNNSNRTFHAVLLMCNAAFSFCHHQNKVGEDAQGSLSLHKLVTQNSESEVRRDYSKPHDGLKEALLDHIQEIETELETSADNLSAQAAEHIHSSELILTLGYSRSVETFLKSAAKQRKFEVVVTECAPGCRVGGNRQIGSSAPILTFFTHLLAGPRSCSFLSKSENWNNHYIGCGNIFNDVQSQQSHNWHAQCVGQRWIACRMRIIDSCPGSQILFGARHCARSNVQTVTGSFVQLWTGCVQLSWLRRRHHTIFVQRSTTFEGIQPDIWLCATWISHAIHFACVSSESFAAGC